MGAGHPKTATSFNSVGLALTKLKKYQEAEAAFEKAIKIFEEQQTLDTTHLATTFHNMGLLLKETGRTNEATQKLEAALQIRDTKLGPNHPDTIETKKALSQ